MMYNNFWNYADYGMKGWTGSWMGFFLLPLVVWSLIWKGWALWKAAKNDSKPWFIALLILNTAGILDILYIFLFGKKSANNNKKRRK